MKSLHILKTIIIYTFIIFILYIIVCCFTFNSDNPINYKINNYSLNEDGFVIYKNILTEEEIEKYKENCEMNNYQYVKKELLNNDKLRNIIVESTNEDYIFQDYIFIIKKSSIHTCHRDANGSFFNNLQLYPSYTMLIYLDDMEKCLDVIPKSHKNKNMNIFNTSITNLICKKGDVILFDANLFHAGTIEKKSDNLRIQMKVTHKNDIENISYYENYNRVLNENDNMPIYLKTLQRNFSCIFPFISDYTQDDVKKSVYTNLTPLQKLYSFVLHGNSNFYDLKNFS